MENDTVKQVVKESYAKIAVTGSCCGSGRIAKSIGYSDQEINAAPEANLGLGCGNPTALAEITNGATVLDLGSGAGFDCFLAAQKVGKTGKVIGVDMTEAMVRKATENAAKLGHTNVEFRLGDIERLPVDDASIDVIISNCVINLAPDKAKVFKEAYRVLKDGGRLLVSDIVLLSELSAEHREDKELIACCVGGAILKDEYLKLMQEAGFTITSLSEDKDISKRQYNGFPLESLKVVAEKRVTTR